jgi:hypothetical protein
MKTKIIFLGLVALTLTNSKATNKLESQDLNLSELPTINIAKNQQESQLLFFGKNNSNTIVDNNTNETTIFDPSRVITSTYKKSIEDVIADDKLITESNEVVITPIYIETTTEDKIAEQNQIIESTIRNEVYPLDFEKINQTTNGSQINNNAIKTTDIKL